MGRLPRRSRGSATVEFALVLPLVLALVLALLQVALLARDQLRVVEAARGGAREAAVSLDDAAARAAALRATGLPAGRTDVEVERAGGAGEPVTVRVRFDAPVVVPVVGWLFPGSVPLSATVTMRQEAADDGAA